MVSASEKSTRASSRCAARWGCSRQPASPSTAANSKQSIIAIRTSRAAKSSGGVRNWRRVLRARADRDRRDYQARGVQVDKQKIVLRSRAQLMKGWLGALKEMSDGASPLWEPVAKFYNSPV